MITSYQLTEIMIGSMFFILAYFLVLYFTAKDTIIYWDILWCTISILIILTLKYSIINYYILQSQNFSSNHIIND